jgi:aspartyl-tRNA synthetase
MIRSSLKSSASRGNLDKAEPSLKNFRNLAHFSPVTLTPPHLPSIYKAVSTAVEQLSQNNYGQLTQHTMEETTSKKGAKKAEAKAKKEAEKARKAAEREATSASTSTGAAAEDLARENYGDIKAAVGLSSEPFMKLAEIGETHIGQTITLRGFIQNSRMQGAKMAFVELRQVEGWAIQGVVAASAEGTPVSKQMVKWIGGIKLESSVVVEATVQKPLEPVKSCKVSDYELHFTKVYLTAPAPETLGLGLATASRAVGSLDEDAVDPNVEGMTSIWNIIQLLTGIVPE